MVQWCLPMFPHQEAARRSTAEATLIAIFLLSRYGTEMIAYRTCMNPSMYFALFLSPLASCPLPLTCENSFDTSSSRKDWIREWLEQFLENYLRIDRFRETAGQHGSLVQGYSSKLGHQLGHQPCRGSPTEWDGSLARWIEWRHLIPIRNNGTNHDYS